MRVGGGFGMGMCELAGTIEAEPEEEVEEDREGELDAS